MNMPIKLVIFDMDGTVIDSMPVLTATALDVMTKTLQMPYDYALDGYTRTTGYPFSKQLGMLGIVGALNAVAVTEYERRHRELAARFALGADVETLTRWLHRRGIHTALVSSTDKAIIDCTPCIRSFDFDCIGGYRETPSIEYGKRSQIADMIALFQAPQSAVLYVGDSVSDADVARDIGVAFLQSSVHTLWTDVLQRLESMWSARVAI